jgi:hypothetical protein
MGCVKVAVVVAVDERCIGEIQPSDQVRARANEGTPKAPQSDGR